MHTFPLACLLLLGVVVHLEMANAFPHPTLDLLTDPKKWPLTQAGLGLGILHYDNPDQPAEAQVPTLEEDPQQRLEPIGDKEEKAPEMGHHKTPTLGIPLLAGKKGAVEDPHHNKDHTPRHLPPVPNKDIKLCDGKPCEMMEKEAMMGKAHEEGKKGVGTAREGEDDVDCEDYYC